MALEPKQETTTHPSNLCPYCGKETLRNCDGNGWLYPTDIYPDGSYLTSRACVRNRNV